MDGHRRFAGIRTPLTAASNFLISMLAVQIGRLLTHRRPHRGAVGNRGRVHVFTDTLQALPTQPIDRDVASQPPLGRAAPGVRGASHPWVVRRPLRPGTLGSERRLAALASSERKTSG